MAKKRIFAIKQEAPDELYTDRQEFIDEFIRESKAAITRRAMSGVLLGQRRMGKSEIFRRVVNRLFFEQDHRDPDAVVPVYFEFPDIVTNLQDFALKYVENFVRWYAAFKLRDTKLLSARAITVEELPDYIKESDMEITDGFSPVLKSLKAIPRKEIHLPEEVALTTPRSVSDWDDSTIAVFLDEFQNTHLPQHNFRVVGYMKNAVESNTCPHFVTGSAMSILEEDILGRGSLFGRFRSVPIKRLTDYHGEELVFKCAKYYNALLPADMATVVSDRCGGNPFYITSVVNQSVLLGKPLRDEKTLNEVLAVDLSSGFIWAELKDQVMRWIDRINEYGITKWVLYLSALEEGDIEPERIKRELYYQDNKDVDIEQIKSTLIQLSRGDLIEYKSFGGWFGKVNDPILQDFLKVWGRIEVVRESGSDVRAETVRNYQRVIRKFSNYKGYLAEVYMIQVLWNSQNKVLPGRFFNIDEEIEMPFRFFGIDQRRKLEKGRGMRNKKGPEVDVYADSGEEIWLCESKWWNDEKVTPKEVNQLIEKEKALWEYIGEGLERVRLWIFANYGVTEEAETLIREHNILWSERSDLDGLLQFVNLRKLPDI